MKRLGVVEVATRWLAGSAD